MFKSVAAKNGLLLWTFTVLIGCVAAPEAIGQREAVSRGAAYGKVYEAAGGSPAAKAVKQKINLSLQTAIQRARRNTAARSTANRAPSRAPARASMPSATAAKRNTYFRPDPALNTTSLLADSLGGTAEEKALLRQLFAATKIAFEQEVAAKGRQNNLSAAFTFFIGSTAMVYHNDPEPSDAVLDELWDGLDAVFGESPEFARLTDREKQEMYDTIVAFSGLVLATYVEGKSTSNAETVQTARQLAGALMQLVLQTDPDKIRFGTDGLNIG